MNEMELDKADKFIMRFVSQIVYQMSPHFSKQRVQRSFEYYAFEVQIPKADECLH